jgi:Ca2+-binding EF-hand superfamily protein
MATINHETVVTTAPIITMNVGTHPSPSNGVEWMMMSFQPFTIILVATVIVIVFIVFMINLFYPKDYPKDVSPWELMRKLQNILPTLIKDGVNYRYEIERLDPSNSWIVPNEDFLKYFKTHFNPGGKNFTEFEINELLKSFQDRDVFFIYKEFLAMLQIDLDLKNNQKEFDEWTKYRLMEETIRSSICKEIIDKFIICETKNKYKIGETEFKEITKSKLMKHNIQFSDEKITKVFQTINVKGDKQISCKELRTFCFDPNYERDVQPKLNKMFPNTFSDDNLRKNFRQLDDDKKRQMTYEEFKTTLQQLGSNLPLTDYKRIFERYCDEDKKILDGDKIITEKTITLQNFIKEAKRKDTHTQ